MPDGQAVSSCQSYTLHPFSHWMLHMTGMLYLLTFGHVSVCAVICAWCCISCAALLTLGFDVQVLCSLLLD